MNADDAGANPVGPPNPIWILDLGSRIGSKFRIPQSKIRDQYEAVAERRMHFIVDEDDDGSNPFGLATLFDV